MKKRNRSKRKKKQKMRQRKRKRRIKRKTVDGSSKSRHLNMFLIYKRIIFPIFYKFATANNIKNNNVFELKYHKYPMISISIFKLI